MADGKLRILVIDDDRSQAELIKEMLASGQREQYVAQHVDNFDQGLATLRLEKFDCVLAALPDREGLVRVLSIRKAAKGVPVIVLTALDDEETALKALELDIQDYLIKGEINGAVLSRSIRYAIQRSAAALQLAQSEERLRYAEEELLTAKEEWERTFNGVPDLIAILNTKNKIMRVNAAMARVMGKKAEECIGIPCYAVFHGTQMPPHSCPHAKAVCESREQITEVQQFGSDTHFLVSYTPLFDKEGNFAGVVHVARDITERKLTERRIEQLNAELASRAADLEAANGELEAFNYTAAHDLRQPLNVIDGSCQLIELLCGQQITDQCHGLLQEIRRGVKRMTLLLDALLNFSRMGRVEPQRAAVDLSDIARSVAKELQDTDPGRSARFVIAEEIVAEGDPALLEIVLRNLIGNAWKYSGGDAAALIEFGCHEVEGQTAYYFVRDNGPGFDMEDAEKLFVPFQRLPGTQSIGGFGIGLATVQRIVARHGGRVWAEGTPGKGAIFRFTTN